MTTQTTPPPAPPRVHADHASERRLGDWTSARSVEVRARRGSVVIDLRSPRIPAGDVDVELELDRSTLTLLVAEDAVIDRWDLRFGGRGRVKQTFHPSPAVPGRRVVLTGSVTDGEIRVKSGAMAILAALLTRGGLAEARRARAEGRA